MIQKQAYKFQYHNQGHIRYCTLGETEFKVTPQGPLTQRRWFIRPGAPQPVRLAGSKKKEIALLACKLEVSIVLKWVGSVP
jgi:hypothetical protein